MTFVLILQPINYCYYSLVKRRIKHLFAIKNLLEAPKSSATFWLIVAPILDYFIQHYVKIDFWLQQFIV
jgi:hypothetical protein